METYIHWLRGAQILEYKKKWQKLRAFVGIWIDSPSFYNNVSADLASIFIGKKTLEKEIKDLEDLSFFAFKTAKLLKALIKEKEALMLMQDDYENETYSA